VRYGGAKSREGKERTDRSIYALQLVLFATGNAARGLRCCGVAMLRKLSRKLSFTNSYYSVSTSGRVDQARIGVRYQAVISQGTPGGNFRFCHHSSALV
jgi:hypothetical protein